MIASGFRSRRLLLSLLFALTFAPKSTHTAITHEAIYRLDWVRQNYAGTFCFYPGVRSNRRSCTDPLLAAMLQTHVNNARGPGLSVAYYSANDGAILGGAEWGAWNTSFQPVVLCLSGAVDTFADTFVSVCRYATRNDDHDDPLAHAAECSNNYSPQRVSDGCYNSPGVHGFSLSKRAEDIITIVTTILAIMSAIATVIYALYKWTRARYLRKYNTVDALPVDSNLAPALEGAALVPREEYIRRTQETIPESPASYERFNPWV
ncbi:hypothetical protein BKA62DRAFT_718744 [Auriculariales sp. MPI-PUGE-AT-0066]|nr:hypothetical protein BKA62DRAFT_718744 [Auriculariales sp. MPI-PUGE-AT-0066]